MWSNGGSRRFERVKYIKEIFVVKLNYTVFQFYYAEYDFSTKIPGTLPVVKGQALRLVRPHDEKGNDEWWLMEDRYGNKGYVPKNYLRDPPTEK